MGYLIHYDDQHALEPDVVGQKFASLARAIRKGFKVPHGAVIRTDAHRYFLEHRDWPEGLIEEVMAFADRIGWQAGLSIRSSAVREDLETQSFAGQYQTFLRVVKPEDLGPKIEKCWLSAEADAVRGYLQARRMSDPGAEIPLMGVILQRMVEALAAGVAFGRNPVNPLRGEMVVEAVSGSGERLVNGHVSPYRVYIDRRGGIRYESRTGKKPHRNDGLTPPMEKSDWLRVFELLNRLESVTGDGSLDMEWAIDAEGVPWLLQYRSITTAGDDDMHVPPGMWTRRIADDLWADRLTPFLADIMISTASRFDLSQTLKLLHIAVVKPTLAVINGYLYVNGEALKQLMACVPDRFITSDMRAFFPDDFDFNTIEKIKPSDMVRIGLRGLLLPVRQPAVNPLACLRRTLRQREKIEQRLKQVKLMPATTLEEADRKLRHTLEAMTRVQENNQWPYFHAAFFTFLLRWLTVDRGGASHADFLDLISSGGQNISIEIERHFRRMSETVLGDPELTVLFLNQKPPQILESMPAGFNNTLIRFLRRFGCRSRHRTLYTRRWSEAPEEVIGILQSLVRQADTNGRGNAPNHRSVKGIAREEQRAQTRSMADNHRYHSDQGHTSISTHSPGTYHPLQPMVRRLARRFLDLREDLRFLLDKTLFEIRQTLLQLGEVSGLGAEVMFLDRNEIGQLVDGSLNIDRAREIARERHRRFRQPVIASTFLVDGQPLDETSLSSDVFKGIGTSPGRASGCARIVSDPSQDRIEKGDILVAQNTDPGWTPILSLVAGMVMEEGGLLNHCSIVARELKIPAVVGIHEATRRIRDGALITIDGGLGLVRIEENRGPD